ncbi:MAG: hypothetical protein ACI837_001454 [Crocinitomicaceae bacterium]|jgi:hypothetical protein
MMKKLYTSALAVIAICVTTISFGQSQRLVLVEHFTQASCGPCASQNPTLEATLNANAGTVIAVKHQVSWPGSDPMYSHYPAGPDDRVSYYGISGVPNSTIDGSAPGAPNTVVTTGSIASAAAIPSPFTLAVSHTVTGGSISVDVDATCTQAVSGNLRLFIAVVEREVSFATAPGSNGETEFFNVLKQYIGAGGTGGNTIAGSWAVTDNATYNESWTLSNVYDDNQLSVIAWIQDITTDEVHQAGYSAPVALYTTNATAETITNVPAEVCGNSITPTIRIKNNGGAPLTSLTIGYDVNGGTPMTYNWTGNLAFLTGEDVALPGITFAVLASNALNITLTAPNGGTDEFPADDAANANFNEAIAATTTSVDLTIVPDNYGSETTWTVKNSAGTTLYSGGPYTDGVSTPEITNMTISASDCYTFTINDAYGDGICCAWGAGSYTIMNGATTLVTGGEFGATEDRLFQVALAGIGENGFVTGLNVYPNPTNGIAHIDVNLVQSANVAVQVYNSLGQLVGGSSKGELTEGAHTFDVDFSNLDAGIYLVDVITGDKKITTRVSNMK